MKNLKKVLSVLLVVVMLATAMVPAFAAETATISADAKVCADIGMLLGDGNGVTPEYTKTTLTRVQAAVLLLRLKGLDKDAAAFTATANFADVKADEWFAPYTAYLKAHPELGFIGDGVNFNANDKISAQQYYKVVLTALGFEEGAGKDYTYDKTVEFAATKGLAKLTADKVELTVEDLAVATVEGLKATVKAGTKTLATTLVEAGKIDAAKAAAAGIVAAPVTGATVKLTGAKKLTVDFGTAVDTTKVVVAVKKGSIAYNVAKITAAADNKSVVVEMASNFSKGDYTVTVSGVTEKEVTSTVTVADDQKVAKIEFTTDKAVLDGTDAKKVSTSFKIYNQYNEDVTGTYKSEITVSGRGTGSDATTTTGKVVVTDSAEFKKDEKFSLSLLHASTGTFASAVLTVVEKAQVSDIAISSLYNADSKTLGVGSDYSSFLLVVDAKDQYGNSVAFDKIKDDIILTVADTTIVNVAGGVNNPTFTKTSISGSDKATLALADPSATELKAGTTTVTMISKLTGKMATFTVTVKEAVKIDTLTLQAPEFAVAGEKIYVPFTAVDQSGTEVTKASDLKVGKDVNGNNLNLQSLSVSGLTSDKIYFEQDYVAGKAVLVVDASGLTAKTTLVITALTGTNKYATLTLNVVDPAKPTVVSGLTGDVKLNLLKDGGATTLKKDYLKVLDQYGRALTSYTVGAAEGNYLFNVKTASKDYVTVGAAAYDNYNVTADIKLNAVKKGSSTITVKLGKWVVDANDTDKDGDKTDLVPSYIAGSEYVFTETVVEKADIASYTVADVATTFEEGNYHGNKLADGTASLSHANSVTVEGVLASGAKVSVPNSVYNYDVTTASANFAYSRSANKVYSSTGYFTGPNVDKTERDVTFVVTVYGANGPEVVVKTAKVTKATPEATTLSVKATSDVTGTYASYKKESDTVVSVTYSAADTTSEIVAFVNTMVKVVDQYGKTLYTSTVARDAAGFTTAPVFGFATANVFVSNIKDKDGNAKTIADLAAGYSYSVTAIADNGKVVTFKVILKD